MLTHIVQTRGTCGHVAPRPGLSVTYRDGAVNHCPGCGRSHWYVGRLLAECGFCGTAIPLAVGHIQAAGGHSRNRREFVPSRFAA